MSSRPVLAILFDLDGTLVHTRIDFLRMKQVILDFVSGAGLDPEPYRPRDILSIISNAAPHTADPDAFLRQAEAALVEIEIAACEGAVEADGAVETLSWLRDRDIRVGIVTRNCPQAAARVFEHFAFPHEVLLTRADTPRVKPDPLHLRLALERLGAAAEQAAMVGDHRMDVEAGKAAGMHTVGVLTPERPEDYFREVEPDLVIRSLPELRTWISP